MVFRSWRRQWEPAESIPYVESKYVPVEDGNSMQLYQIVILRPDQIDLIADAVAERLA